MAPPKPNHKGKRRHFSTPEEIQQSMNRLHMDGDDNDDKEKKDDSDESDDESGSDDEPTKESKPKGVSALIQIENPNRNPKKPVGEKVELSRREREEIQKQEAKERYQRLHAEGKTEQAKADLARLELIRKQRAEANAKREQERREREAEKLKTKQNALEATTSALSQGKKK